MNLDEESIRKWLDLISQFIDAYSWLTDSFILNFFVDNHFDQLPALQKEFLQKLTPSELGNWITTGQVKGLDNKTTKIAPLSLLCFRKASKLLSLDRSFQVKNPCKQSKSNNQSYLNPELRETYAFDDKLLKLLTRRVKPKKIHEISHISTAILELSSKTGGVKNLVDVGSGIGHLCRFMSHVGFSTLGIDSNARFLNDAKIINEKIEKALSKQMDVSKSQYDPDNNKYVNEYLEAGTRIQHGDKFGLIGLHGCGDLGGIIVENFVQNPDARFLCFASCCYMKIKDCYPLSAYLKNMKDPLELSYEALELACHAKETYTQRLKDPNQIDKLKIHCYRACLEIFLVRRGKRRLGLRSVKNAHLLDFKTYALKATEGLDIEFSEDEFKEEIIADCLSKWNQVIMFFSLRHLFLAPIIETCVLLDRALYILEHGFQCEIRPLFDPNLSARNLVIIGLK